MRTRLAWQERMLIGLIMFLLAAIINYSHITRGLDNAFYDWHLGLWSRDSAEDIVVIAIDDNSIQELGSWPWPRRYHAKLLDRLRDVKAIGLDIIFAEADSADPEGDKALASAIGKHGQVILPVSPVQKSGVDSLYEINSIPLFTKAAAAVGHVDLQLDDDNISRGLYLRAGLGSPNYPALPVAMYELHNPSERKGLSNKSYLQSLLEKDEQIWVGDQLIRVPFSGNRRAFHKVSYVDVLSDKISSDFFTDKWVLVGMHASGLGDRINTPVSSSYLPLSGVEYEAQVLDALLRDLAITPLTDNQNFLLTTCLLLLMAIYIIFTHSGQAWLGATFSIIGTLLFSVLLMRDGYLSDLYWFKPGPTVVALLVGFFLLHRQQFLSYVTTLNVQNENAEIAMSTVSDAIIITNKKGLVEFMNPNAEALTGYLIKNVRMTPLSEVLSLQDARGNHYPIDSVVKNRSNTLKLELPENHFLLRSDGQLMPVRASARPLIGDSDEVNGVIIAFDEQKHRADLSKTVVDPLTLLPNLELLYDRLEHAIQNANRTKLQIALLYINLEDFKRISETSGQQNGDYLIKGVAQRLVSRGRLGDTVARIGHTEFAIVLENLHEIHPVALVAASVLEVVRKPYRLEGNDISLEASIGISIYPRDGLDVESLRSNAYTAMNKARRAKHRGGAAYCFYSQDTDKWALDKLLAEDDLSTALKRENFELFYLPRIEMKTGKIVAVEALISEIIPNDSSSPSTSFVPLSERSDLHSEVGIWAMAAACKQAKFWQDDQLALPKIAVNLSPRHFSQVALLDIITQTLVKTDLSPRFLELAITESALISDPTRCVEVLHQFRELGGSVTIEGFGAGYSSLSDLKDFPVDRLQIDKIFIQEIPDQNKNDNTEYPSQLAGPNIRRDISVITNAIIDMAHGLGIKVVANGVETNEQYEYLQANGCDEIQGTYFSEPLSADKMTLLLQEGKKNQKNKNTEIKVQENSSFLSR